MKDIYNVGLVLGNDINLAEKEKNNENGSGF